MASDPYIDIYRASRKPPVARPRGLSLVDQTIQDDRDEELRINAMTSPAPEQVARQTRVAREAGVEPALVGDLDMAERAQQANRTTQVLGRYPAFGRWAASDPRGAVAASDDHESLGMLGRAWETTKAIPAALSAGMEGAAARYMPISPAVAALVDGTEDLYALRPDRVRRLIVGGPNRGLAAFSDAFRLKD